MAVTFNIWGNGSINRTGRLDTSAATYVLIHGYQSTAGNSGNSFRPADWIVNIAQSIRNQETNANVVLLDWEQEASSLFYPTAAANTRSVGQQLATFLRNNSLDPNFVNLIGHSLGAHVAGFAGAAYRASTGRSLAHISGLDPAGPSFEGVPTGDRLDPSDAARVVAIHTSTTLGFDDPLGTVDIYPNRNDLLQPGQLTFVGNHGYAHTLYTELLQGFSFPQSNGTLLTLNTLRSSGLGINNTITRDNRATVALSVTGTSGNNNLAGGAANDTIRAGAGNDYISGGAGSDSIFGDSGNDIAYGGQGNDSVYGGTGSDRLFGDSGNDVLTGVDAAFSSTSGRGEIDRLTGNSGADRFVLGRGTSIFYNDGITSSSGTVDYALITDFNPLEDTIQLGGSKSNYSLASVASSLPAGIGVFFNQAQSELIAIIQGATGLSLGASYFVTA